MLFRFPFPVFWSFIAVFLLVFPSFAQQPWSKELTGIGTFSSPRVADLNNDGVKDIILGAGREEFHACDTAVFALDGRTGNLLWNVSAKDQIFGSATLKDINKDGVEDIIIGGRSAELMAIDGTTGKVLWRFQEANELKEKWFNFYNPQFVEDQNGDGLADILVSNGGDVLAKPHDPNRPTGYLVLINSSNGKILHKANMPDGKETYMSIGVHNIPFDDNYKIVFGTGGETIGGNLYVDFLSNIKNNELSTAQLLHSSEDKGYIGPPSFVDLNEDDIEDVVVNSVNGQLLAFDGKTQELLWKLEVPDTESYNSVCIGYFNDDDVPDLFISYALGVWPKLDWSIQKMVNGKTGQVEFTDSLGFYQNTSPIAIDLDGNGRDEVVMSLNFQKTDSLYRKYFYNTLAAIEFSSQQIVNLTNNYEGNNLSSTPWIGDLDGDNFLDIVYCHGTNLRHTYTFDGIKIHRIPTKIPIYDKVRWGAYQGSSYNGHFLSRRKK